VLEVVILIYVYSSREFWNKEYRIQNIVIYGVFLLLANTYFSSTKLAWIDSGIYNKYEFYVSDINGEKYLLTPSYFSPFDCNFSQNRFDFINKNKVVTSSYGGTLNKELISFSRSQMINKRDILDYIDLKGRDKYDKRKKEELVMFLKRFIKNKENDLKIGYFDAPMHIWQGENLSDFNMNNEADSIFIVNKLQVVREELKYITVKSDTLKFSIN
jgi:hypothetical protein